ncbi:hypothetical protein [Pseudomonas proteolytica]|uniref:hypothetical protein n=2 Tax=Pseudomonas TaxID=286 RepID=UPI0030D9CE34
MTRYRITTDHPMSSYGEPVLLDGDDTPYKAGDLGLFGLSPNFCGRVDAGGKTYWSGYGDAPDRMWRALRTAHETHPDLATVEIIDLGLIRLSA